MAARRWSGGDLLGEYKDLGGSSVMSLNTTGNIVLLASKRILQFVNIHHPNNPALNTRERRKTVKWDVDAAQWNPHSSHCSQFVITRNQIADVFTFSPEGEVKLDLVLESHTRTITDLDWSPFNENLLLTCSSDANVLLWDTREKSKPVKRLETLQSASQVKWNKIEESVIATSHDRDFRIWDIRRQDRPIYINAHLKKILSIDWSRHCGKLLATAGEDEMVKFWECTTPGQVSTAHIGELQSLSCSPVWKARFTPFENGLLTIDVSLMRRQTDNSLLLWNTEDLSHPEVQHMFLGHRDVVTEFAWRSPSVIGPADQYELVTWSRDHRLMLWKYESSLLKGIDMQEPKRINDRSNNNATKNPPTRRRTRDESALLSNDPASPDSTDRPVDASRPSELVTEKPVVRERRPRREPEPSPAPPVQSKALESEFRFMSKEMRGVEVTCDKWIRECSAYMVLAGSKYEHRLKLVMSFPDNYPSEPPEFSFDPDITTLSQTIQTELMAELKGVAQPLVARKKACIEPCINKLLDETERIAGKIAEDTDSFKNGITNKPLYEAGIPSPRTCGATFCNDTLITFQRAMQPIQNDTPRSLADVNAQRSRNSLYPSKQSPKTESLQVYQRRKAKTVQPKNERNSNVTVYNASQLQPTNKQLALQYNRNPTKESCLHNARIALVANRSDLHQIWHILGELVDPRLKPDEKNPDVVPWAALASGRPLLESIMEHYSRMGDIQTLAMITCMFPLPPLPQRTPLPPPPAPPSGYRGSGSRSILGTSPARSVSGRSPPEGSKHSYIEQSVSSSTSSHMTSSQSSAGHLITSGSTTLAAEASTVNGVWSNGSSRTRRSEQPGFLQDIRHHNLPSEAELQKHREAIHMLSPKKRHIYNYYKQQYGDILYKWGLFNLRSQLLDSVPNPHSYPAYSVAARCNQCILKPSRSCAECQKLRCALCRSLVRGLATVCVRCGHGGHVQHIRDWFSIHDSCVTGCGCSCPQFNSLD